jgi:hypothetical protein
LLVFSRYTKWDLSLFPDIYTPLRQSMLHSDILARLG